MKQIKLAIPWRVLTKNNKYRRGRHGNIYLAKEYRDFEEAVLLLWLQVGNQYIPGEVTVDVDYYFYDRRSWPDEDNLNKTIGDLLQKAGFVENDRFIHWGNVTRQVRRGAPGAEITITEGEGR